MDYKNWIIIIIKCDHDIPESRLKGAELDTIFGVVGSKKNLNSISISKDHSIFDDTFLEVAQHICNFGLKHSCGFSL